MGTYGLGVATYAVRAVRIANQNDPELAKNEMRWQIEHMSDEAREDMKTLPIVGENSSGPLGPEMLSRCEMGSIICKIQLKLWYSFCLGLFRCNATEFA